MSVKVQEIKNLREETGAGIADVRQALEEAGGNPTLAKTLLRQKGLDKANKKGDRDVNSGLIDVYSHSGKVGVVVELLCETDFVAKTEEFKDLAHEISLQIASMNPSNVKDLLSQDYIRDASITVEGLLKSVVGKVGENIKVGRFERVELGSS